MQVIHVTRTHFEKQCVNLSTGETSFSTVIELEQDGVKRLELHVDHVPTVIWTFGEEDTYQAGDFILVSFALGKV